MNSISKQPFVLLVDDYLSNLKYFGLVLRDLKIGEVLEASNFNEAREIIDTRGNGISLLITDYHLGEKNGGDIIRYIKEHHNNVKTVLITGHKYVKELAQDLGADGYVDKKDLEEGLREVLKDLGFLRE